MVIQSIPHLIFIKACTILLPKTKIGMCCISAKHITVKSKNKIWLAQNHDNVSECSHISPDGAVSWH